MSYSLQQTFDQQFDRSQQINEALVSVPGCRTVNAERSSLELPVVASDGSQLVVRVTLVPSFPRSAPVIVVSPPIRHPWVDVSGSVSPPSLFSWGQNKNVRLSSVLQQVRDELAQRLRPTSQLHQPTPSSAVRPGSAPGMVPEVPQQFAGLSRVPTDQLMQALSDPAAYKSLLDWMEGQLHLSKPVEEAWQQNEKMAQENLALGDEMLDLSNQIAIVRSSEFVPAEATFRELYARHQSILDEQAPKVLLERLEHAAREADGASDALLSQAASVPLDTWITNYLRARTTYHLRDIKLRVAQQTIPQTT